MTIESPSIRARVFRSVSAEPASGSDIDTATTSSPLQTAGSTFRRSASGAKCSIARAGPTELSKTGNAIAGETFANSSRTSSASRLPSPRPPYASATLMPRNPISA